MTEDDILRAIDEENLGIARDRIIDVIAFHEAEHHDGGCCLEERVNAVAFVAHSLGLKASCDETWQLIRKILELVYEAHHSPHLV